jgi:hypothetical protein
MALYLAVLNVGIPVWGTRHTNAPTALFGLLYALNTLLVVLLQIVAVRTARTLRHCVRTEVAAGLALGIAAVLIALAAGAATPAAIGILGFAVFFLSVGEVVHSVVSVRVSYYLAGAVDRTRNLAVYSLGRGAAQACGPAIITGLVVANGTDGWIGLAAFFCLVAGGFSARVRPLAGGDEVRSDVVLTT